MDFNRILNENDLILMEGGTTERVRRNPVLCLDDHVGVTGLLVSPEGRGELGSILRGYIRIGQKSGRPIIIGAPTWRAGPDRCRMAGLGDQDMNALGVEFAREVADEFGGYAEKIVVAGYLACQGDAYDPGQALGAEEAERHHAWQAQRLAKAGADLLFAATLPALSEALGLARAMAATGSPYLLSFITRPTGRLLDGTPLDQALDTIDQAVDPAPDAYMINCVFPDHLDQALEQIPAAAPRLAGLQANTSDRPPEELDGSEATLTMDPDEFARAMHGLHQRWGLKILGGCCGTDESHMRALADLVGPGRA